MKIPVSAETLAEDLIQMIGVGGSYLTEEHTLRHFRSSSWQPAVFRREAPDGADAVDPVLAAAIGQTRDYLRRDFPPQDQPLDEVQRGEIDRIVARAEKAARP